MGNEALDTLAREYIRGELSTSDYRERRKAVIDEITGYVNPDSSNTSDSTSGNKIVLKVGVISAVIVATLLLVLVAR